MKCKYYAISGAEILKKIEYWHGVAYLSGYSGLTISPWKHAEYLRKNLKDFAPTKNFSPRYVYLLAGDFMLLEKMKRCESIRNGRDKMHVKTVTAARWLYESFVNEEYARSPYHREALEYVRGMANAGIVMDPFRVMEKVGDYLAEVKTFKQGPK